MAKKEILPSSIYVVKRVNGDVEWLEAGEELTGMVAMGEKTEFGVYTLTTVGEVEGKAWVHKTRDPK